MTTATTCKPTDLERAADLRDRLYLSLAAGDLGNAAADLPFAADELVEKLARRRTRDGRTSTGPKPMVSRR